MKKFSFWLISVTSFAVLALSYTNCSNTGMTLSGGSASISTTPTPSGLQGLNSMQLNLGTGYINQVTVSIIICAPGSTTNCQYISNLLLDTGSTGVRVFSSAISSSIYNALPKTGYGNCTSYASNNYDWGPMVLANVQLGQEMASNVPIQVIDNTYGDTGTACVNSINANSSSEGLNVNCTPESANCAAAYPDVAVSGYNGIVGVNFLAQDCGSYCVTNSNAGLYFTCTSTSGGTCTMSTAALSVQMTNPVSKLTYDNNGVILSFPYLGTSGVSNASGTLYLGIGTQPNNTPSSSVKTLTADPREFVSGSYNDNYTMFSTLLNGNSVIAFIDSGSGCMSFPAPTSPVLPEDSNTNDTFYGFYNPTSPTAVAATQVGYNGVQSALTFYVAAPTNSAVLPACSQNLGGSFITGEFDWGLPFFLGRSVYVSVEGTTSTLDRNSGDLYWAY
jgi:hypothetical protein